MANSQSAKYVVSKPLYISGAGHKGRQSPAMTYMSRQQVPEANTYIEIAWINDIPQSNPHSHEQVHDFDEIIIYWGKNSEKSQVLGGEIEAYIGGQPITFNTTAGIFIPKGTPHGPFTWKKCAVPHLEMFMVLGTGDPLKEWGQSGKAAAKKPVQKDKFDYEQYVIRSPMRESPGAISGQGRQSPTMTYMSETQITGVKTYLEFGWIYKITDTIREMKHDNFEEIVLHIGNDPANPEDLGADMTFGLGGEEVKYNTNYAMFIPRGMVHGPLIWHEVRRHHIEMAIMLGAGTLKEGWGFDLGDMTRARAAIQRGEKIPLVQRDNQDKPRK
ncbi:MAG: hypothetical protein A2Z15_04620 [Chloroflexi bacterium RBG_16_50_11]|nr:MAG: hypothetical protein A2Z15_04620 [Chloroflexi bacterium RBG_16_50_11]